MLVGDTNESLMGNHSATGWRGFGHAFDSMAVFPHFKSASFDASFPIARLTLNDADFPAVMKLTAFNPIIPNGEESSSIPAAFFEWEIENTSDTDTDFEVVFTLQNPSLCSANRAFREDGCSGLTFYDAQLSPDEIGYSDIAVITDSECATVQEYWCRGEWRDGASTFRRELEDGSWLRKRSYNEPQKNATRGHSPRKSE